MEHTILKKKIQRCHYSLAFIHRWPRTLAGITSHQYCLQLRYPSLSVEGGMEQKKASRYCDRTGKWEDGDYSNCHYTNGITRVLHTFILVSRSAVTAVVCWFNKHSQHDVTPYVLTIFPLLLFRGPSMHPMLSQWHIKFAHTPWRLLVLLTRSMYCTWRKLWRSLWNMWHR